MKELPLTVQNYLAIERGLVSFLHNENAWKDGGGNVVVTTDTIDGGSKHYETASEKAAAAKDPFTKKHDHESAVKESAARIEAATDRLAAGFAGKPLDATNAAHDRARVKALDSTVVLREFDTAVAEKDAKFEEMVADATREVEAVIEGRPRDEQKRILEAAKKELDQRKAARTHEGAGIIGDPDGELRAPGALTETQRQSFRESTSKTWGWLRQARVFDIPPMTYGALYHECDVYTTEEIYGKKWRIGDVNAPDPDIDPAAYTKAIQDAGKLVPLPEHVAFPVMFLGYGAGIGLTDVQYGWRFGRPMIADNVYVTTLVGHLIDRAGGNIIEFLTTTAPTGKQHSRYFPLMTGGEWTCPETLAPWVIGALIDLINGYRKFVVQDNGVFYRSEYQAHAKKKYDHRKAVPPPFYTLHLKDETVRESGRETIKFMRKAAKPEHRYDVRGHERIRVNRGMLPLDDKLRRELVKRRYKIFTIEPLDQETWRLLAERRMPGKRPGEWVAILRAWVDDYKKGPENAPYIPAVRVVPKRRRSA